MKIIKSLNDFSSVFFIGVAGSGMSALAQYLCGMGKKVSGSDRYFNSGSASEIRSALEREGIKCYAQGEGVIDEHTDLVVASAAIEDTVYELVKARELNIPVLRRSELLSLITSFRKTIAVGGTSGKSTTTSMIFHILKYAGLSPGIISGAGLVSIIKSGKIGNTEVGTGDWLVIEADESDGSIVQYHPEIGLLLNIDKDHQEIDELIRIFTTFKNNTKNFFIVNHDSELASSLSQNIDHDFSARSEAGTRGNNFKQIGAHITFSIDEVPFTIHTIGRHNMENALAAVAVAKKIGVSVDVCAEALRSYEGIYRRHQVLAIHKGVTLIDDYAHNPAKCAASIKACQPLGKKVIAWFQPHGFAPTRFLKDDFIRDISNALRAEDEIWMSEIFYAGGTTNKNISSNELVEGIRSFGKKAFFVENRLHVWQTILPRLEKDTIILLMGARDPGLEQFADQIKENLLKI